MDVTHYFNDVQGEPGSGVSVYSAKSKARCNPLYRTSLGTGPINEFAFSPCGHYLAAVSQVKPGKNIYNSRENIYPCVPCVGRLAAGAALRHDGDGGERQELLRGAAVCLLVT